MASALLLGLAAFHPSHQAPVPSRAVRRLPGPLLSSRCGAHRADRCRCQGCRRGLAAGLAAAALTVMIARMSIALELLERSRSQALTDDLTGLGNRRRLVRDLERRLAPGGKPRAFMLALFDLDGFKRYNDTFGHPQRRRPAHAARRPPRRCGRPRGRLPDGRRRILRDRSRATRAGCDGARGRRRMRSPSTAMRSRSRAPLGSVSCPAEAADVAGALRIADGRCTRPRRGERWTRRHDAGCRAADPATSATPRCHEHMRAVATLAVRVARRARAGRGRGRGAGRASAPSCTTSARSRPGRDPPQAGRARRQRAAVHAPVPGRRRADHALRAVTGPVGAARALLARALGRRRLSRRPAHDEAPIGARIIGVCDAYHAMRSAHPYRPARTHDEAVVELLRCAGHPVRSHRCAGAVRRAHRRCGGG